MAMQAITLKPQNAHNAHIIAHGLFEAGQPAQYLEFLGDWIPAYANDALMWGHLQWHAAIAELELGNQGAAQARCVSQLIEHLPRLAPFMALADGASLLWRLRLRGAGELPWPRVAEHARENYPNGSNAFGEIHLAMVAAATRDVEKLALCAQRLERLVSDGYAGARPALKWVAALTALGHGRIGEAEKLFDECKVDAVRMGGSHAQRCIIDETREAAKFSALCGRTLAGTNLRDGEASA